MKKEKKGRTEEGKTAGKKKEFLEEQNEEIKELDNKITKRPWNEKTKKYNK